MAGRSYHKFEVRGGGREDLPQERSKGRGAGRSYSMPEARGSGQEELPYAGGQERQLGRPTPRPRSSGCVNAGGLRGAIPH